ncbi:hypothetical protein M405DRAFT_830061 [Rhizopogon salebrosus TDB-379]|nr:hypothetical protein M405DRAFT_830061 [Rhizopogon salebrosus TDB-379]
MDYEVCASRCLAPLVGRDGPASGCDWLAIGVNSMSSCWVSRTLVVGMGTSRGSSSGSSFSKSTS